MSELTWRFLPSQVEEALEQLLPHPDAEEEEGLARLREAMRHGVFSGGKRLRSQLVLEAASVAAGPGAEKSEVLQRALPAAMALELIHSYSLIHDDLPAMDDAQTRRGRPCCHKVYGDAMAILAGDALLTMAFEVLTLGPAQPQEKLNVTRLVAVAAGERGMVGGQNIDIAWTKYTGHGTISAVQLSQLQELKTGALIRVAAESGAILGGGGPEQVAALRLYGEKLGRAFQIWDDVLDVIGDPEVTGKASSDADNDKMTFPAVHGLDRTRAMALEESEGAVAALAGFGPEAATLRQLARFVVTRNK